MSEREKCPDCGALPCGRHWFSAQTEAMEWAMAQPPYWCSSSHRPECDCGELALRARAERAEESMRKTLAILTDRDIDDNEARQVAMEILGGDPLKWGGAR